MSSTTWDPSGERRERRSSRSPSPRAGSRAIRSLTRASLWGRIAGSNADAPGVGSTPTRAGASLTTLPQRSSRCTRSGAAAPSRTSRGPTATSRSAGPAAMSTADVADVAHPRGAEHVGVEAEGEAVLDEGLHPRPRPAAATVAEPDRDLVAGPQEAVLEVDQKRLLEGPLAALDVVLRRQPAHAREALRRHPAEVAAVGHLGARVVAAGRVVGLQVPVGVVLEAELEPAAVGDPGARRPGSAAPLRRPRRRSARSRSIASSPRNGSGASAAASSRPTAGSRASRKRGVEGRGESAPGSPTRSRPWLAKSCATRYFLLNAGTPPAAAITSPASLLFRAQSMNLISAGGLSVPLPGRTMKR